MSLFLRKVQVEPLNYQSKSPRLDGIESLRAYAALAIVFFHLSGVGMVTVPTSVDFIQTHFGFGVPLFFVVSGFSMAYGYSENFTSVRELHQYFVRRFTRIAPLFYVILVFQLLHLRLTINVKYSITDIFLNAIFAFNFIPHLTEGIVPASWSIGVEMIFYVVFPFFTLFCKSLFRKLLLMTASIVLAVKFSTSMKEVLGINHQFVYHNFISNLPYFCWGILGFHGYKIVHSIPHKSFRIFFAWITCGIAFSLIVMLYMNTNLYMFFWNKGMRSLWDTLWGIPFAMFCIGIAVYPIKVLSNPLTQFMGKISYSLYLVHPTIIYYFFDSGIYANIYGAFPEAIWLGFIVCSVITIVTITLFAYMTYRYIERPGMSLGRWATKRIPLSATQSDPANY